MGEMNFFLVWPVVSLASFALLILLFSPISRRRTGGLVFVALAGVATTTWFTGMLWRLWRSVEAPLSTFNDMVHIDGFGLLFSFLLLVATFLTILVSSKFLEREEADHGEFYALLLFAAAGMLVMLHTRHLMMVLIGLEIFSLALYILTGLTRGRVRSIESALKYFLLGAFSSGFLVYGMALLYGATGSLDLYDIGLAVSDGSPKMLWIGFGMLLIGLFFKIAVVPFHHWVPDVYQGAPTNVTGFMAAATKTAAFAVLLRILHVAFGAHQDIWVPMITWLSIFTMTVANLVALTQNNIKRLLAFSSISHAGYLLIALACDPALGRSAIMFYLAVYVLMTIGAFAVITAVGRGTVEAERGYDLSSWAGLGWSRPVLGLLMLIFMLSLAGIPPTGGFLGKYVIFQAAIQSKLYMLAIIGVLNAVVGAFYYLKVIKTMYFSEQETEELPLPLTWGMASVMIATAAVIMYLGIAPGSLLDLVRSL